MTSAQTPTATLAILTLPELAVIAEMRQNANFELEQRLAAANAVPTPTTAPQSLPGNAALDLLRMISIKRYPDGETRLQVDGPGNACSVAIPLHHRAGIVHGALDDWQAHRDACLAAANMGVTHPTGYAEPAAPPAHPYPEPTDETLADLPEPVLETAEPSIIGAEAGPAHNAPDPEWRRVRALEMACDLARTTPQRIGNSEQETGEILAAARRFEGYVQGRSEGDRRMVIAEINEALRLAYETQRLPKTTSGMYNTLQGIINRLENALRELP